jgi:hypothetical protein
MTAVTAGVMSIAAAVSPIINEQPAQASGTEVAIGMPFDGKWAYSNPTAAACGPSSGQTSHPSCHETYFGDWSVDVYNAAATPVKLHAGGSNLTYTWGSASSTCGSARRVNVFSNGTKVGEVQYSHLADAASTATPPTEGTTIGTIANLACNPGGSGKHVHVEFNNVTNNSCYTNHSNATYTAGMTIGEGTSIGKLGSPNTAAKEACAASPETPNNPDQDPSQPLLELSPNGGFVAFARNAASKELYHSYQTGPGTGWSNWLPVVGGQLGSQPTIHKKADGSFVVFALNTGGNLVHTYQSGPGGGWSALTGIAPGGVLEGDPTVTTGANGGLVVFARGTDKQLYHVYQNSPNGAWSGWNQVIPGQIKTSPILHKKADGSLIAFAVNNDNKLVHTYQSGPGGGWSAWSGVNTVAHDIQGKVEVEVGANGGLVVFARDTNNQLYHVYQTSPTSGWSNWEQVVAGTINSSPTVHQKPDGTFVAFALDSTNKVVHSYQYGPGSGWSPWTGINGSGAFQGAPEIEVGSNGGLIVYARGVDKRLYHSYQTSPTSGFSGWYGIGGSTEVL